MRAFILSVCLWHVASGFHSGGIGERFGSVIVSRDAPEEDISDKSYVPNKIKQFVGHAMSGLTADDMVNHCNGIKAGAQAQLDAGGETVSDEEADALLREMASKYPAISPADLLNSDTLMDESTKVTISIKILMDCAEQMKRRQGKGEPYNPYLKVVIKLCNSISKSARVSQTYMLALYKRSVNKRNRMRRQGPWSAGGTATYDPNGGLNVGGKITYDKAPWKADGTATYNPNQGWNYGGKASYNKDNLSVDGGINYNKQSGTSYNVGLTYRFR